MDRKVGALPARAALFFGWDTRFEKHRKAMRRLAVPLLRKLLKFNKKGSPPLGRAVEGGTMPDEPDWSTFEDGHKEVAICEAVLTSHKTQSWVEVNY